MRPAIQHIFFNGQRQQGLSCGKITERREERRGEERRKEKKRQGIDEENGRPKERGSEAYPWYIKDQVRRKALLFIYLTN